jgi:hypothetical protein
MPISRSLRAKAKQTRLAFSPLPSSSPAKHTYSSSVQDRLANVRYTGSRNRVPSSPPQPDVKQESLPTPEPSSQLAPRSSRSRPTAAAATTTPDKKHSIPYEVTASPSDADDLDDVAITSTKRRRLARQADLQEQDTPTRKSTRLVRRSSPLQRQSSPSEDGSFNDEAEIPSSTKTISELGEPESTGDEDDVLVTKPIQKRGQRKKTVEDPFVVDDDWVEYISSDKEPALRSRTKSQKATRDDWLAEDDEIEYISSDEEALAPSSSRKKSKAQRAKIQRRKSRQEQEELEDDLADLRDSDHSDDGEDKKRTRGGPVTTQRDKARQHFELLKRRRAGEKVPQVLDSDEEEDDEEPEPVDIDYIGRGEGLIGAPHEISDDSSAEPEPTKEGQQQDEDDFVVDDVSSRRLGLPHPDIPLEFTSYASAKPKDLFIHVIEWLVKNRIAPAFSRDDPIYKLALSKVSDQVTAQAGSRLISSAWNAEFKYAILARPNIEMTYLGDFADDDDDIPTCDACNRTNHPARFDFVLTGEAYRKRDLEPVADDSDDEDNDGQRSLDEAGHTLPSKDTHFYLGRYCAANAEMGHKLVHWQYHLNQNLLHYLEEQGVLSVEATLARDKMNRKKREKEAEAIVDSMEETGVIQSLWRDFQSDLDDARLGMEDFEKKGKRGQGRIGTVRSSGNDGLIREWNNDRMTIVGRAGSDDDD